MRISRTMAAAAACSLFLMACDDRPDSASFRCGEAEADGGLVVAKWSGLKINRKRVKAIVDSCAGEADPAQTCTLWWRTADDGVGNVFQVGLECNSAEATPALLGCYLMAFQANDAEPL